MTDNWDELTPLERDALALIVAALGWEPKSARGFIAGQIWGCKEKDRLQPMDIADAYHEWFYNLTEGSMKFYRNDNKIDLTRS